MSTKCFLSLESLSARCGLPQRYLRRLAAEGMIPALDVSGRLRFDEEEVVAVLRRMAAARAKTIKSKRSKDAGVSQ